MPLFSIVMPTRNRANLLPNALQSALEQTYSDYEIVVSNNNSTDDTEQVVRNIEDGRVRYVQSDTTLPMSDSWEFALSHAKGEYITILSDDDAVSPTLLERLSKRVDDESIKLISWMRYLYVMDDWYVERDRNKLFLSPITGQAEERSSKSMLQQWFDGCTYYADAPMLFNACCHRSIIDIAKKKAGRFFIGTSPDVAASIAMLSATPHFLFIDDVLSLAGSGKQSTGANTTYNRGSASQTFLSELDEDAFPKGPFKEITLTTSVADTLITAKETMPDDMADYQINWASYFIGCYKDLMNYQKADVATADEIAELWKLVFKQPTGVKLKFMSFVAKSRRERTSLKLKSWLKADVESTATTPNPFVISGAEAGFTNILECARLLDSFVSNIVN